MAYTDGLKVHPVFGSKTDNWHTPPWLWQSILAAFNLKRFACDPCSDLNIPADLQITKYMDGLKTPWARCGHVWVNPPYQSDKNKLIKSFVERAVKHFAESDTIIWLLLPSRATQYIKKLKEHPSVLWFDFGKIQFGKDGDFSGENKSPFGVDLFCLSKNPALTLETLVYTRKGSVGIIQDPKWQGRFYLSNNMEEMRQLGGITDQCEAVLQVFNTMRKRGTIVLTDSKVSGSSTPTVRNQQRKGNIIMSDMLADLRPSLLQKRKELLKAVDQVNKLLESIGGGHESTGATPKTVAPIGGKKHKMSAEGRARIAAAQKARWAKIKAGKK